MHTFGLDHTRSEIGFASCARPAVGPLANAPTALVAFRYSSHGRAALATALDGGLMPDEVRQILAGRRVVDAFPIRRGEGPAAYAVRAVSEMFVAYLSEASLTA